MNRQKAIELNSSLNEKGLKCKHVSGENYLKLMSQKALLKNSLNALGELEQDLAVEFDAVQTENGFFIEDKDKRKEFATNLRDKQNAYSVELDLNFIPENELREYCKEQDTSVSAVLFEYLLKK